MPKKAEGGGGNYLGTQGLVALAKVNAVVITQRVEHLPDFKSDKPQHKQYAASVQIRTNILVVSSDGGARDGEFWPDQNLISAGWTLKLGDDVADDGEAIVGRAATYGDDRPCLNTPSDAEWKLAEKAYADNGIDVNASNADELLFAKLRKSYSETKRDEVRAVTASVSGSKSNPVDDDEPPF